MKRYLDVHEPKGYRTHKLTPIEYLRRMVDAFGWVREDFLSRWTVEELELLYLAWMTCGWDIPPDQWTEAQLTDALRYGIAPAFRYEDESPITYENFGG